MKLNELVDDFLAYYKLECLKRKEVQIDLQPRLVTLMLSEVCSDIQKTFGAVEVLLSIPIVQGTDQYALNASVMTVKNVMIGTSPLIVKSTDWMQSQQAENGLPSYYSIIYPNAIPKLWVYPNPVNADTIVINYNPDFNLYSPSSITAGDFGNFLNDQWSGNTTLPTQYDKLLLYGMLKKMFPEFEVEHSKEELLLMSKQFNGETFEKYKMTGVIKKGISLKIRDL